MTNPNCANSTTNGLSTGGVALRLTPADTTMFWNSYFQVGIAFTVLALVSSVLLQRFLHWRLDRTLSWAHSCSCNKNNKSVSASARGTWCLGRFLQLFLLTPFILLMIWAGLLLRIGGTPMIAICTFLLFPAFFLYLWSTFAWRANGYSFYFGKRTLCTKLKLIPLCWFMCVFLVFAFNGLAVFTDRSFSFISVSWFFISLNMLPLIALTQWNEPGEGLRERLWKTIGSQDAINTRRESIGGGGGGGGGEMSSESNEASAAAAAASEAAASEAAASETESIDGAASNPVAPRRPSEITLSINPTTAPKVSLAWNLGMYLTSLLVLVVYR